MQLGRVGEAAFEEQWERGRAMNLLEAIDQASEEREPKPKPDPRNQAPPR